MQASCAYKAELRQTKAWRQHTVCRVGISVGKPFFEGDKLAAILNWIATRDHFQTVIISVADTLQRFGIASKQGITLDGAETVARERGDEWLGRNRSLIDTIIPGAVIWRWDQWRCHRDFTQNLTFFRAAYEGSGELKAAIDADVHDFIKRQSGQLPEIAIAEVHSRDYLLEELAVHTLMGVEQPASKIYPSPELRCLQLVRSGAVRNIPSGLGREYYTYLRIVRKRA